MITLTVRNASGGEAGSYQLNPADLVPLRDGQDEPVINKQLLHDVVVMYEANRRVGTVRTKSRGMVRGSTKKLYRQKGTGRARAGASRTPVRRGGGHTFAKVPIDYSYRLPKKAVRLATKMALLSKFTDEEAVVVDEITMSQPSTKTAQQMLNALGASHPSALVVTAAHDRNAYLSCRNIPGMKVASVSDLNAYDLLRHRRLVIAKSALDAACGKVEAATA